MTVKDSSGTEQMIAHYSHRKSLEEMIGHGLVLFDDEKQEFVELIKFEKNKTWQSPQSHPLSTFEEGIEYVYFPVPFPNIRVQRNLKNTKNQKAYEAYTCLKEGFVFQNHESVLDIQDGKPVYSWKSNTDPIGPREEKKLIEAGLLQKKEAHFLPFDLETKASPILHSGSVHWNDYRKKWIMIGVEIGGKSFLGEVWYAECDTVTGPWTTVRKIVTHDQYSFYNPVHHPFFDQQNGQNIYFEGTYSKTFSGNNSATPRYDYNQILYRLDLSDPKLRLN